MGFMVKKYNTAAESVQKETVSLLKRACRARATHPSAVDYMVVKQLGFVKWLWLSNRFPHCYNQRLDTELLGNQFVVRLA